jgi:hypothetical protein
MQCIGITNNFFLLSRLSASSRDTRRNKIMREPPPSRSDLNEIIEQIEIALGRPLRRTEKGAKITIAERIQLAKKEIIAPLPDAAAMAFHAEGLERATAMFSDTMPIPVTGGPISMAQFREALEFMQRLQGPSPKQDTAKQIIAEIAAGLVQELVPDSRRLRVYREVAGLFHQAVCGYPAELKHQRDAVIRERKKYNDW